VTVFRDGRFISSKPAKEVTPESAIRDMVGREMEDFFAKTETQKGEHFIQVRNLNKEKSFSNISFDVRAGEILGFAGLVGAQRTNVGLALFGIEPADSGEVLIEGQPVALRNTQQALEQGIAYVTEDRRQLGLTMPMSIASNITLPTLKKYLNRLGLLRQSEEKAATNKRWF